MTWRLIKFLDGAAILENEKGEQHSWPRQYFPENIAIGDVIRVEFLQANQIAEDKNKTDIINTILSQ
ncbi:MAG: hypothetical protein NUV82_04040 [Candidatus Komeilibacteria bacterium]|nr:hypothetical protein [Candidatus Komeilibacteria bacterium]